MNELLTTPTIDDARQTERRRLGRIPGCRFVELNEFASLATSWRKLERRNLPDFDFLGLFDLETNEWFLIDKEQLDAL